MRLSPVSSVCASAPVWASAPSLKLPACQHCIHPAGHLCCCQHVVCRSAPVCCWAVDLSNLSLRWHPKDVVGVLKGKPEELGLCFTTHKSTQPGHWTCIMLVHCSSHFVSWSHRCICYVNRPGHAQRFPGQDTSPCDCLSAGVWLLDVLFACATLSQVLRAVHIFFFPMLKREVHWNML